MPAVSIARLQNHLELLRSAFNSPQVFVSELKDLLELYSDRTFHPGEESKQDRRIPHYYIPILLEKQLDLEFRQLAAARPDDAFANAKLLWGDKHFESRLIAAGIIGAVTADRGGEILNTINLWLNLPIQHELLVKVLEHASRSLRKANAPAWFEQIKTWLATGSTRLPARAILALLLTAQSDDFDNLPLLLSLAEPMLKSPPSLLIPDLADLYQVLVARFPGEMLVFTRELMGKLSDPNRVKLLRKVMTFFDDPTQAEFRRQLPQTRLT